MAPAAAREAKNPHQRQGDTTVHMPIRAMAALLAFSVTNAFLPMGARPAWLVSRKKSKVAQTA